jgi:diphthamide biosynthesis enzyme Dph1/Dph2-like protein
MLNMGAEGFKMVVKKLAFKNSQAPLKHMYELELDKVISLIKERKHKIVMIQLPDGLKPRAGEIVDAIRSGTGAEVIIWMASCYGACDLPFGLDQLKVDLFIQWGHNRFNRIEGWSGEENK